MIFTQTHTQPFEIKVALIPLVGLEEQKIKEEKENSAENVKAADFVSVKKQIFTSH